MTAFMDLWMPILVSAALVFVASNVVWMLLPIHKKDYRKLGSKENAALEAIRSWGLDPGVYMFPGCDPATMKNDPGAMDRFKAGPWGLITVRDTPPSMMQCLGSWVLNILILSALIGYLAAHAVPSNAEYLTVFRIVGTGAFLAYGGSILTDSIWKGRPWSLAPGALFDAALYAGVTAGSFAWLWPHHALPGA